MAIEVDVEAYVARVVRSSVTVKLPRDAHSGYSRSGWAAGGRWLPTRCSMPRRWR